MVSLTLAVVGIVALLKIWIRAFDWVCGNGRKQSHQLGIGAQSTGGFGGPYGQLEGSGEFSAPVQMIEASLG